MWWALIVEERLGRLVIMQSLSRLNTPWSLLQHCVTWLFTSSDTNAGLSWQLVISRYQTITPGSTGEWDSSWAGAGVDAFPAERCPGSPQAAGHPERGCWLVCPNQSSSPCVHSPAQNLPVHGCYSPVSEVWECSWHPKKPKKLAWGQVDDAGYREVGSPSNSPCRSYGQMRDPASSPCSSWWCCYLRWKILHRGKAGTCKWFPPRATCVASHLNPPPSQPSWKTLLKNACIPKNTLGQLKMAFSILLVSTRKHSPAIFLIVPFTKWHYSRENKHNKTSPACVGGVRKRGH